MTRYSDEFQTKEQALDDARASAAISHHLENERQSLKRQLAASNAEIERLRALAYAAQEFLSPEEWRFEQPSYKPGLDASNKINKLRNLLISTYHTLGAHQMLSSAETWNDVANQLRTEIEKTIFPKEDDIKKIH